MVPTSTVAMETRASRIWSQEEQVPGSSLQPSQAKDAAAAVESSFPPTLPPSYSNFPDAPGLGTAGSGSRKGAEGPPSSGQLSSNSVFLRPRTLPGWVLL